MAQDDRPRVRVTLSDGQYVIARLHQRKQWPKVGWMYQVGIPAWTNTEEGVEAREYRVWLIPGKQVDPIPGVSYEDVPTIPPPTDTEPETAAAGDGSDRWAFKVQRLRPSADRRGPGGVVVHIWDCPDAPAGNPEIDVYEALEVMRTTASAVLCKECGAAVALGPLVDAGPE